MKYQSHDTNPAPLPASRERSQPAGIDPSPAGTDHTFTIVLSVRPGPIPAEVRMRQALKLLLRAFGFRCISIAQPKNPAAPSAPITQTEENQ